MTIQRFAGVVLNVEDACTLLEVLENASKVSRPGARAQDITRRLRSAIGSANKPQNRCALPADLGQLSVHDLLTAGEVALIIGCTTANVRYLRSRNHLPARRVGSRWLYPAEPVVVYAERKAAGLRG
jgi:hypothetical protein